MHTTHLAHHLLILPAKTDPKGRLPKVPFPRFDGEQPRHWKARAEKYFRMYFVEQSLWISVSEMHFDGASSLWYQSIEDQVVEYSWPELCALLLDRFDRDQHEYLIRQLLHVHQTSTVAEYLSRFTQLADQLKAYNPKHDQLYFTMRFIDGLRLDIKSVVLLPRPKTLDTAPTITLLQEEVTSLPSGRAGLSGDWSSSSRPPVPARRPLPLLPPPTADKVLPAATLVQPTSTPPAAAKLSALKAYRRAQGLCYKYGAKWSKDHTCSAEVLLAVEAVWDSLDELLPPDDTDSEQPPPDEQAFLAISKIAMGSSATSRVIRFQGSIQGHSVLILLDSGSSASFLSPNNTARLTGVSAVPLSSQVRVAGGGLLDTTAMIPQLNWTVGQCSFISDFRVLPIGAYDAIVGMDWLSSFSPMQIHWQDKWLLIPYQGQWMLLQGVDSDLPDKLVLQVCQVMAEIDPDSTTKPLHPQIQAILDQYPMVLQPPTDLPPSRKCNHSIPLIPGVQPVFIRPSRYPPALKDEIEKQVSDMLSQGLIRPSSSPFSSPVEEERWDLSLLR